MSNNPSPKKMDGHEFVGTTQSNNPNLDGIDMYITEEETSHYQDCDCCGCSMGYWESVVCGPVCDDCLRDEY